jgi:hypothetical protein
MAKPDKDRGDVELNELFDRFDGRLVSPGGAAALLGVKRQTIHTLCKRGVLRYFKGPENKHLKGIVGEGPAWGLIPLEDVATYALRVGRLTRALEKLLPPDGKLD